MSAQQRAQGHVGFFKSVSFRVALIAVIAMLAFRALEPVITEWAKERWPIQKIGFPHEGEFGPALIPLLDDPTLAASDAAYSAWLTAKAEALREVGRTFYVLDGEGKLTYRSADLALLDPLVLQSTPRFCVTLDGEPVGTAHALLTPIVEAGERRGFLAYIYFQFNYERDDLTEELRSLPPMPIKSSLLSTFRSGVESRHSTHLSYRERIRWIAGVIVSFSTALIFGVLVSWFFSRRLKRLARQTAPAEAGFPGPFSVSGSDEIGVLADAMNEMRAHILELVAGLEKRDHDRREWIAHVSHDLRTPLTSLRACLDRAERDLEHADTAELREAMRLAQHDAQRLQTLAEDLLDAARLEAGSPLVIEPILPREVLRDAMRSVRPLAESRGVELTMLTSSAVCECCGDGERLLRACENLIRNAVRHASGRVEVGTDFENESIVFWVRDDGAGFGGSTGLVDLAVARAGDGRNDGASLGLLVVERVAAAHHGDVELRNLDAGGAEVRIRIPIKEAA